MKIMNRIIRYTIAAMAIVSIMVLPSCEDFLDPKQELNITEDHLFQDWYEYRAVEMGLYGLQQKLVEQLVILGELRGDLMTITEHADADMVGIHNFNISKTNKYASPTNFFKLIGASNNFIRVLEKNHPEVLNPDSAATNYDRLYGEALCMRAWAYFNAARIYGKIPYIPESLVTIEEINSFIEAPGTYIDSVHIVYGPDGYYNDTSYNVPVELEKNYFDLERVLREFTHELEENVKAVGVNHYIDNNDDTWEVTIWNTYAYHALLGHMYLTLGDLAKAYKNFEFIMLNPSENLRYQLDGSFEGFNWLDVDAFVTREVITDLKQINTEDFTNNWRNIFTDIDNREHIFSLWFNKANFQQNELQSFFEIWPPHNYMLKPSGQAIFKWETVWSLQQVILNTAKPEQSEMAFAGLPGDFTRGYGASYLYVRNGVPLELGEYIQMIYLKANEDFRGSAVITEDVDTIIYKYSIGKGLFDKDANFPIYRAASIHLYMAEVYANWNYWHSGILSPQIDRGQWITNDGSWYSKGDGRPQLGVKGRAGLVITDWDGILLKNEHLLHDPFTNEIIGYENLSGNLPAKQRLLEHEILEERARELAFEGERFYDLMRVAKRRQDPSYLASAVASKFPASQRDQIYNYLLDENNWYIHYFE